MQAAMRSTACPWGAAQRQGSATHSSRVLAPPRASAHRAQQQQEAAQPDRRAMLAALVAAGAALAAPQQPALAASTAVVPVSDYLPEAPGLPGFRFYMPDPKKTPGIRAGVVRAEPDFYSFAMPEGWSERPLSGPQTGNFCFPRCEEPWYEFKFEGKEGSAQLVVAYLQKLGAKPGAKVAALGTPEQVVLRVGNFITGTYLEEDDVVSAEATQLNGRDFYVYEVATPYASVPGHSLAAFTTKDDLAYLFVVSTSEKTWGSSQDALRKVLGSFKV